MLYDRKTKSGTSVLAVSAGLYTVKSFENAGQSFWLNSHSVVLYRYQNFVFKDCGFNVNLRLVAVGVMNGV
jgi:hypothetical protein